MDCLKISPFSQFAPVKSASPGFLKIVHYIGNGREPVNAAEASSQSFIAVGAGNSPEWLDAGAVVV